MPPRSTAGTPRASSSTASPRFNTGVSATNKIFTTVWTGARPPPDFSNFNEDASPRSQTGPVVDRFVQLADLSRDAPAGIAPVAQGMASNAVLSGGDLRSAVNNVIGGGGNVAILSAARSTMLSLVAWQRQDRRPRRSQHGDLPVGCPELRALTLYAGNLAYELGQSSADGAPIRCPASSTSTTDQTGDATLLNKVAFSNSRQPAARRALCELSAARPTCPGLHYWTAQLWDGMSILQISESFYVSRKPSACFPTDGTSIQVVTAAYEGALGRAPDAAGLALLGRRAGGRNFQR